MATLSPASWLAVLDRRLQARQKTIERYNQYYDGEHRLTFATAKYREAFGFLFREFADNWCGLVVDAAVERLKVEGFRFGDNEDADQAAWEIWQANNLDAYSKLAHREAVKGGESYVLVDPNGGQPRITVEHPSQAIVATAPGSLRERQAGLKKWVEDDGFVYATLYLPDGVHKFRSQRKHRDWVCGQTISWVRRADDPGSPHRLGVVPMIPLMNNPNLLSGGQSDLMSVLPLQDAANKIISDMLVASEFQAFQQRWATGMELPTDPVTGERLKEPPFIASMSRLWTASDPNAKFGAFPAVDLKPYVTAVEMIVQHIAAQTRTPPHYLLGQSGAFPSGESLQSTETGLVARVEDKQVTFGEAWEEAIRLAFRATNDTVKAEATDAETIWRDPASRTEGEHVDATLKLQALGVPQEALWERAGFTPQQIKRFKRMKAKEARQAAKVQGAAGQPPQPQLDGQTNGIPAAMDGMPQ